MVVEKDVQKKEERVLMVSVVLIFTIQLTEVQDLSKLYIVNLDII